MPNMSNLRRRRRRRHESDLVTFSAGVNTQR